MHTWLGESWNLGGASGSGWRQLLSPPHPTQHPNCKGQTRKQSNNKLHKSTDNINSCRANGPWSVSTSYLSCIHPQSILLSMGSITILLQPNCRAHDSVTAKGWKNCSRDGLAAE
eukprot:1146720-Pelagomonas_calceolata.AAC.1